MSSKQLEPDQTRPDQTMCKTLLHQRSSQHNRIAACIPSRLASLSLGINVPSSCGDFLDAQVHATCDPDIRQSSHQLAFSSKPAAACCCLQDFGEHGREFITCEVGMELVKLLAEPAKLAGVLSSVSNSSAARTIDNLINHVVFKVGIAEGAWAINGSWHNSSRRVAAALSRAAAIKCTVASAAVDARSFHLHQGTLHRMSYIMMLSNTARTQVHVHLAAAGSEAPRPCHL
jgi:hypothetical protein